MLSPSRFAIIGHDSRLLIEFPESYSPDKPQSTSGQFVMGAQYTSECMFAELNGEESYGGKEYVPEVEVITEAYARDDVRRIILGRRGVAPTPRLVIEKGDHVVVSAKYGGGLRLAQPYSVSMLKDPTSAVDVLVVYWNVDHVREDDDGAIAKIGTHLQSCSDAEVLLLQLSATTEVSQKVLTVTIQELGKRIRARGVKPSIIVTNTASLDNLGVTLHRGSSWERFADDLCLELSRNPASNLIELLRSCHYVVVRGSDPATALVTMDAAKLIALGIHRCDVYYPVAPRVVPLSHEGYLVGGTNLITSAISAAIIKGDGQIGRLADHIIQGVTRGVQRNILFEQRGYFDSERKRVDPKWHVNLVHQAADKGTADKEELKIAAVTVGKHPTWSLTQKRIEVFKHDKGTVIDDLVPEKQLRLARAALVASYLVRNGVQNAAQKFEFPFAQLGDAFVVDRFEYEQYMEMQAAMRSYVLRKGADGRPLSLAVFGRPGAGKTFGVKQLPKTIGVQGLKPEPIEANVSQFETLDDLAMVMQKARDAALNSQVPLVLWDEFDCECDGKPFGWFRYFLAPMQDGTFKQGQLTFDIRSAIFVFIGGVNHDFDMFHGRMRDQQFIQAKGPDFASRIRAHLDIKEISSRDDDLVYMIRRAVFLRGFLLKYHRGIVRDRGCDGRSGGDDRRCIRIAPEVLRAFLMVERYEHGVRSLEALVQMCTVSAGQSRLSWSGLPSAEQMEGHVSAREFNAIGNDVMPLELFAE